jgi:hypothetical protein
MLKSKYTTTIYTSINSTYFRFVPHCNNALRAFNLQFNAQGKSLSFLPNLSKQFQEGFEAYRKQYHLRKKARQAKMKKS